MCRKCGASRLVHGVCSTCGFDNLQNENSAMQTVNNTNEITEKLDQIIKLLREIETAIRQS